MKNLAEMKRRFAELFKSVEEFSKRKDATPEEIAANDAAMNECETLKADIETEEKRVGRLSALKNFAEVAEPAPSLEDPARDLTKGRHGVDIIERQEDGTLRLMYTDDPLFDTEKQRKMAQPEYRSAFRTYMKCRGDMDRMDREERRTMEVGVDENGGYLVPPQMLNKIIGQRPGRARVVDLVTIQPTGTSGVEMIREEDTDEDVYGTVLRPSNSAEGRTPTEDDQDKLKLFTIQVHEELTSVKLSRTFMEDAPAAVENHIARKFRTADRLKMESKIISGTGVGEAFGILTRAGEVYGPDVRNIGDPIDLDEMILAYYEMPEQYAEDLNLLMRRATFGQLSTLQDGAGAYAFGQMNVYDGQVIRPTENFKGTPCVFSDLMPAAATNAKSILYGNFAETYMAVVRSGLSLRFRDLPDEGYVKAVFRKRWGGDVTMGRAMKIWQQTDP